MIGTQISQYRLIEKLGEGGMGVVYKGIDTLLDRPVAIKLISTERGASEELLQRFKSEAKVQATLSHPNITTLYSYLVWEGRAVMVMEYIEGETLQQMITRRGPIPADVAVPLFKQALLGVGAAHRRGIVHRDIKPANIMVNGEGIIKVMDFGIAKVLGVTGTTRTNLQMGTVWYMAPEQVLNRPVDARTDIYSLGVTLYELLSGQVPFRADSEYEVLSSHVQRQPQLPTDHYPHIPKPCVSAVMKALSKEPDQRYASTDDFSAALDQFDCGDATSTAPISSIRPKPDSQAKTMIMNVPSEIKLPSTVVATLSSDTGKRGSSTAIILTVVVILLAGAAGLFLYAMHEREQRESAGAGSETSRGAQRTSGGADEEKRLQAEQAQSAQELQQQLASEQAKGSSNSGPTHRQQITPAAPVTPIPRQQPTPPLTPAPAPHASEPDAATRLTTLSGTWSGTYTCAQGVTGATLQIVASSAQSVGALFQFAVPNSNPGSYFLHGTFDPASNRLVMNFTKWKNQPPGYTPGNISGVVNFSTYEIRGNVVLPGCAALSMHKQ